MTEQDAEQLGDRVREAVSSIVGRRELEEFRLKTMPLEKRKDHLRPVD